MIYNSFNVELYVRLINTLLCYVYVLGLPRLVIGSFIKEK